MTLDNLTLGTLNAESVDNTFMDDAMNPLGGLNIPSVENIQAAENQPVQESGEQQDPPGKKKSISKELQDLDNQQKQLTKNWSNTTAFLAQTKRDPRLAAGAYQYDQYVTNVDKYRGYNKSTFNKIGFNPLEDNDKRYNENTSWYQDYYRMASHFLGMWGSAFWDVSTPKALYNLFTPSSNLVPGIVDIEASEKQAMHMRQGGSTRGGITEWGNNFLLNSAYTIGIISNVAAEEMAIATATALSAPETGGASVAAGAVATAENLSKLARIGKAWREGMAMTKVGSLGRMVRSGGQMLTSLNKVDGARTFWQAARAGGNAAVDFVNPLRGTTTALKGMSGATLQLSNAAKFSKGFGAFYRDMREFNYTLQEARLEAGGVYDRFVEEQIGKIRKEGREPSDIELQDIYEYARQASELHGWTEIPIIFATNRIVFDGLFRFKGIKAITEAAEAAEKSAAKGIMFDAASRSFKDIPKVGLMGQIGRTAKNPRVFLGSFLNYTRANFAEGFQELVQEGSADGIVKYYSQLYDNPENGNADYIKGSVYSAFDDQIFSKQGLSTFMSGFLMGGMMSGVSKSALNVLTKAQEAYLKKTDPEKFQQYQEQKIRVKKELLNSMNQLISDPERFFSPVKESFLNQKRGNDNMVRADLQEDDKAFVDAKDDKMFDHVFTALNRGTFGMVINGMKEMGKLSEAEIAEAMNLPTENGSKAKDKVSEYVKRAEQIKSRFEYFQDKMPNPFKPAKFQKGSIEHVQEFLSYKAFDDARKSAIASQYGFDRSLERMNNITRELSEDRPLQNASATDITVLLNEKDLNEEIKLLRREIKTTGEETADQKAIIKQKTKRLETLEDYKKNLKEYKSVRGTTKITEDGQIELFQDYDSEQALRKSYETYLRNIAKLNNDYVFDDKISSSFKKVMDFYELDEDSKSYNAIVNNLLNPENFKRHTERIFNVLADIYTNREQILESSIDKYLSANELNALTIALGKLGIIIKPEEILELYNSGLVPSTFLDMRSNKEIDRNDPRYEAILEIIGSFKDIQEEGKPIQQPPVTEAASQPEQAAQQEEAPRNIDAGIPAELAVKLEDAYNRYIEETGSDISYDDFVENSITAARIKEQFNSGQTQPAATPASVAETEAAPTTTKEEGEEIDSVDEVQARLNKDLGVTSKIITDAYLNGLHYIQTEDGKYYVIPDSNAPGYGDVSAKEVTKEQIIKPFRTEAEWKKVGIGVAALEGAKPTANEEQFSQETQTPTEKTGAQKAQERIDSVSSIRDLFDMNSEEAVELINDGISSIELRTMLQKKREELVKNISTNDLQKFDIVSLKDGSKVVYVYTKKGKVHVKTQNDGKGEYTIMNEDDFLSKIENVEPGKNVSMEPTQAAPVPDITEQEKNTVNASKDSMNSFVNDAARLKKTLDDVMNQSPNQDGKSAEDDLLDSLGCDT